MTYDVSQAVTELGAVLGQALNQAVITPYTFGIAAIDLQARTGDTQGDKFFGAWVMDTEIKLGVCIGDDIMQLTVDSDVLEKCNEILSDAGWIGDSPFADGKLHTLMIVMTSMPDRGGVNVIMKDYLWDGDTAEDTRTMFGLKPTTVGFELDADVRDSLIGFTQFLCGEMYAQYVTGECNNDTDMRSYVENFIAFDVKKFAHGVLFDDEDGIFSDIFTTEDNVVGFAQFFDREDENHAYILMPLLLVENDDDRARVAIDTTATYSFSMKDRWGFLSSGMPVKWDMDMLMSVTVLVENDEMPTVTCNIDREYDGEILDEEEKITMMRMAVESLVTR